MLAICFEDYGPPSCLKPIQLPQPIPGPDQLLIRIVAAAVNPADSKIRSGMFRDWMPISLPHVLGYDVAGIVQAVGDGVTDFRQGDRVATLLDGTMKGGYAEYALAHPAATARVPDSLDLALAASIPTAGLTGVQLIEEHIRPAPGETVLITGATGAVGRSAVHAALGLGARVIAAVRQSQMGKAQRLGVHEVIDIGQPDMSNMDRFNHVADTVGGPEAALLCHNLAQGGRICTVATTPIDPVGLPAQPQLIIVHADGLRLERLAVAAADGEIELPIARRLPLAQAAEAHRLVEAGGLGGKVVLLT